MPKISRVTIMTDNGMFCHLCDGLSFLFAAPQEVDFQTSDQNSKGMEIIKNKTQFYWFIKYKLYSLV